MSVLAFALAHWRDGVLGLALVVLLVGWSRYRHALIDEGRAVERAQIAQVALRRADSTIAALRPQLAHAESVWVHDTVRFTRWRDRVDTLTDTVYSHLTDTVLVKAALADRDSTIAACSLVVQSCTERARVLTAERDAWRQKAQAAAVAVVPDRHSCVPAALVTGGVGALLSAVLFHTE